jgi:hypothetical protein
MHFFRGRRLFELIIKLFALYKFKKTMKVWVIMDIPSFFKRFLNLNTHKPTQTHSILLMIRILDIYVKQRFWNSLN